MKVGSRVELKATREQGKLVSFDYHLIAPICTVILDDGREIKAMLYEVRPAKDRKKKGVTNDGMGKGKIQGNGLPCV